MAQGNFGNEEQHREAGRQSGGNKNAAENLTQEDREEGGRNSHGGGRPQGS